jgi:hypothetical protein
VASIKTGKPDVSPDASAHQAGVREGNRNRKEEQRGHRPDGRATAARSTGINPGKADVIDPRMPSLPPS